MRRLPLVTLTILIACCWGLSRVPALAEDPGEPPLPLEVSPAVARALESRVTYTNTGATLGEVLRDIGDLTGADLLAAARAGDLRVSISVSDVPLRALLEDIARLFGYKWRAGTVVLLLSPIVPADLPRLAPLSAGPPAEELLQAVRRLAESFTPEQLAVVRREGLAFASLTEEQQRIIVWYVESTGVNRGVWPDGEPIEVPNSAWRVASVVTDPPGLYVVELDSGRITREGFVPMAITVNLTADLSAPRTGPAQAPAE